MESDTYLDTAEWAGLSILDEPEGDVTSTHGVMSLAARAALIAEVAALRSAATTPTRRPPPSDAPRLGIKRCAACSSGRRSPVPAARASRTTSAAPLGRTWRRWASRARSPSAASDTSSAGRVEGTYDRHAYVDEMRAALDKWAERLSALVEPATPANVVPIKRKAPRVRAAV